MKYIFVSGGVVSGLGKGITSSSIGTLLQSLGYRISILKIDMYLNQDAGTIRPQEHGEVFVTADGMETDQDLGNYERFLSQSLRRENYMTAGQVYRTVLDRERAFGYEGEDVEAIPHVTDEIITRILKAGKIGNADVVIVELGGTVGEFQNGLFFEANRILKLQKPRDVIHIHVTYVPLIKSIGELKSKPAQQSVQLLQGLGIQPDFLVTRSEQPLDGKRKEKIAVFSNLSEKDIISNPDIQSIYSLPLLLNDQRFGEKIVKKLHLRKRSDHTGLAKWKTFEEKHQSAKKQIRIAMVGKYFKTGDYKLTDSYVSVIEAVKQAAWMQGIDPKLEWIDSTELENSKISLQNFQGIIVPQGWGSRGVKGKLKAVRFARENNVPYLGLCFGMQMATIEFARNVLGLKNANSTEVDPKTKYPVVHIMPDQIKYLRKKQYGGTIRLGSWPCQIKNETLLAKIYQKYGSLPEAPWNTDRNTNSKNLEEKNIIYERHRHRYEFNNDFRDSFEKAGFIISGTSPDGRLVEAIELTGHPFFIGTQFHPEYIARPLTPHPIFQAFIMAITKK